MIAVLQVDPQGMGCLWEQMCHPLATVVVFPQCPGGSSLGKKRTEDNALGKLLSCLCLGLFWQEVRDCPAGQTFKVISGQMRNDVA